MVESVVINTAEETSGPTLEEQAAAMDAAASETPEAELPSDQGNKVDRPEWLPEKFETAEDMAKSYAELEAKLATPETPVEDMAPEEVVEEVEARGLDFDALSAEYYESGELTSESYQALQNAGIPKEVVDQYIAATEQAQEMNRSKVMDNVGGEEAYTEMLEWAADNLSDAEIDAFNTSVSSNDYDTINMAVKGLAAMKAAETGREPSRSLSGATGSDNGSTYGSVKEMMDDMNNPNYHRDPAFRAKVEAKLSRSNIL